MDREVVTQKLESLRRSVNRVRATCPSDLGTLRGFRNIAVHNDEAINWDVVFSIANDRLGDFSNYARALVRWMPQGE